jgi:hypothetical protein
MEPLRASRSRITAIASELDREADGRWIAEVPELNVIAYGIPGGTLFYEPSWRRGRLFSIGSLTLSCPLTRRMPRSTSPHEFLAFGQGSTSIRSLKRIGWRHDRTVGSHKFMKGRAGRTIRSRSTILQSSGQPCWRKSRKRQVFNLVDL